MCLEPEATLRVTFLSSWSAVVRDRCSVTDSSARLFQDVPCAHTQHYPPNGAGDSGSRPSMHAEGTLQGKSVQGPPAKGTHAGLLVLTTRLPPGSRAGGCLSVPSPHPCPLSRRAVCPVSLAISHLRGCPTNKGLVLWTTSYETVSTAELSSG